MQVFIFLRRFLGMRLPAGRGPRRLVFSPRISGFPSRVLPPLVAIAVLAGVITMTSCAPGNERYGSSPAGFFAGLWHGAISVVTFVISLFNPSVHMYETRNAGTRYDAGFLIGALAVWGGIFRSHHASRARRCGKERT